MKIKTKERKVIPDPIDDRKFPKDRNTPKASSLESCDETFVSDCAMPRLSSLWKRLD